MPITPGCQPSPASTYAGASGCSARAASASNRMRVSVSRRSRLRRSSSSATSAARPSSSVSSSSSAASARCSRPGGVDPRREPEAERVLGRVAGLDPRDPHQRPQPRLRGARQRDEALAHEPPVLAAQRHHVGDRGEPDQVEVLGERCGVPAGDPVHRLRELVRDRGGAQLRERVVAEPRVHHHAVGQLRPGPVVVGDHDLEPELAGARHLGGGGDRAVDRHEQAGAGAASRSTVSTDSP